MLYNYTQIIVLPNETLCHMNTYFRPLVRLELGLEGAEPSPP